jgi:hypothetical protein
MLKQFDRITSKLLILWKKFVKYAEVIRSVLTGSLDRITYILILSITYDGVIR